MTGSWCEGEGKVSGGNVSLGSLVRLGVFCFRAATS